MQPGASEDSSDDSEETCGKCHQRSCPIPGRGKKDDWIGCDICQQWYHGRCVGVKKVSAYNNKEYFCEDCEDSD